MSTPQQTDTDWQTCASGTLVSFGDRERARRRRQSFARTGTAAALVVVLTAGALMLSSNDAEPRFGGIGCTELRDHLPQYASGVLAAETAEQIRLHLEECPDCQQVWKETTQAAMQAANSSNPSSALLQLNFTISRFGASHGSHHQNRG